VSFISIVENKGPCTVTEWRRGQAYAHNSNEVDENNGRRRVDKARSTSTQNIDALISA
jgi:hypothetical protein